MQSGVSVCMTTYNQEKYIAEAIESVMSQKTTFPVQLVIGEDCSPDGTPHICRHYASLHSNISVFCRDSNLGLAKNLALVWAECKGKYIAILEGDDLWSSPDKLQTQVELMEQHPEYSMCFTRTKLQDENNANNHRQFPYHEIRGGTLTISDIIRHNLMANCSVMYRGGLVPQFLEWMLGLPYCDLALHCLHLQHGLAGYIPEYMAIYRMHEGSAFECKSMPEKVAISSQVYIALSKHLNAPYADQAKQPLIMMYLALAFYGFYKMPFWYKLTGWTIALEELNHLRKVR